MWPGVLDLDPGPVIVPGFASVRPGADLVGDFLVRLVFVDYEFAHLVYAMS